MKITLEPGGAFPPSKLIAANIRAALDAAMIAVDDSVPDLQPGTSLTVWFDQTDGSVKCYTGLTPVTFQMRHSIVSETAPANPVNGLQWLNSNDGGIYTWYNGFWIAGDAALPFGVEDLLALIRASTVSATPPANPTEGQQWFRTADGYTYTWFSGAWVAGEATFASDMLAIVAELEQKASKRFPIVEILGTDSEVLAEHADAYVRFLNDAVKTYNIGLGAEIEPGTAITLRNVGAGALMITADPGVTLNYNAPANILASGTTAQLLNVGLDIWDLI